MTTTPRHIAVVALRRSGTTALWKLLRQDDRFACYDEPFSHLLGDLPAGNVKQTRDEFIAKFERDPAKFRALYAPITRREEVTRGLTGEQTEYLRYLLADGPTIFDVTRCMGKIPALHGIIPEAVLVHLFRHPVAFASSHLLPSDRLDVRGLRKRWNRATALDRATRFNGWGMEELLRCEWLDRTNELLGEVGVQLPPKSDKVPAAQRLLAGWLGGFRLAEREGRALYGDRFLSLSFEDVCRDPATTVATIQKLADAPERPLDTSGIRSSSGGIRPDDKRWLELAREAGFTGEECARFFPEGGGA